MNPTAGMGRSISYPPIADYAIVGDCHSAALISRDGSIDWYCPTQFDAPALFCRLLDVEKGGYLRLAPASPFGVARRYRGATNVLETVFTTHAGRVRVTDLMPVEPRAPHRRGYDVRGFGRILRLVESLDGVVELELRFKPTCDYARGDTEIALEAEGAVARGRGQSVALACPGVRLESDGGAGVVGSLRLTAGGRRWIVLSNGDEGPAATPEHLIPEADAQLERTIAYWEGWAAACTYRGPYRDQVLRSALTLKLLTYEPTGAVVAAPTTSLPEHIGGERNWDYRYAWLRDSALMLYALMTVGFDEEAGDFFDFLGEAVASTPREAPQIMYRIDGGRELAEQELSHLAGYRGSRPVRIGNGAAAQRQLDVYGEVLSAAYLRYRPRGDPSTDRRPPGGERPTADTWALLRSLVDRAEDHWREPGNGIWEVRGAPGEFLYSRLMCWVALDRGLRLAREHALEAPVDRWRHAQQEIRSAILARGYDAQRGAFTQAFGSPALDASALAIPRVGFLPPTDPRVRSTVRAIREGLTRDGLVDRYRRDDGLGGDEGTFALCSFWLVDALALGGQLDEARDLFEQVVRYANDVGLLAEEIDPRTGALLGNFPQGFTHMALIGSAVNLAKAARHGAEAGPENEGARAHGAAAAAAEGW